MLAPQKDCPIGPFYAAAPFWLSDRTFLCIERLSGMLAPEKFGDAFPGFAVQISGAPSANRTNCCRNVCEKVSAALWGTA